MKIEDYKIIQDIETSRVAERVRDYSRDGWQTQGPLQILPHQTESEGRRVSHTYIYVQVMVLPFQPRPQ